VDQARAEFETSNILLRSMPQALFRRLRPHLEPVALERGALIYRADGPVEHLYFVDRGLVSLVMTMQDGRTVEIGVVGIEGVTGVGVLFGVDTAVLETVVQIPGAAYRIGRAVAREAIAGSEALRGLLQRYAHFVIGQLAQTAACNRLHSLEERCCRWLLIAHDSARSDDFLLTHEFLAMMLGAQRPGVSLAASILQRAGLIRYTRGHVTITDRPGLEAAACECYGAMRAQLRHFVGEPTSR